MRYTLLAGCRKLGEIEAKSGYFTNFGTFSVLNPLCSAGAKKSDFSIFCDFIV